MRNLIFWIIVFGILSLSNLGYSQEYIYSSNTATVLREQPLEDGKILFEINRGERFVVIEKQEEWVRVFYNETIGYIQSKQLVSTPPQEQALIIDFIDIRAQYAKNKQEMTKFRFESWWEEIQKKYVGELIQSQGYVEQAKETWGKELIIQINIDPPSEQSSYDLKLKMDPINDKDLVAKLDKNDHIKFTGRLAKMSIFLGSLSGEIEQVGILSQEKYVPPKEEEKIPSPQETSKPVSSTVPTAKPINRVTSPPKKIETTSDDSVTMRKIIYRELEIADAKAMKEANGDATIVEDIFQKYLQQIASKNSMSVEEVEGILIEGRVNNW